jgi:diguanylate cyclase
MAAAKAGRTVGRLWLLATVAGVLAVGAYFLLPEGLPQSLLYNAVGLVSGLFMLVGVRLHRPARAGLWFWFAAGQVTSVIGDVIWEVYEYVRHEEPFPSAADVFYLAMYPLLVVGLLRLTRDGRGRDLAGLIDAAIVATGLGLVFWVFVLQPIAVGGTGTPLERLITTAYPVADVLLLALLARLFTGSHMSTVSSRLLGAAAVLLLSADVTYAVVAQHSSYEAGDPIDAVWLTSYVLWGVAALHPSMARPQAAPEPTGRSRVGGGRLVLLTASSLLAPVLMFLPGMREQPASWIVLASGAVVLFLLVALRMSGFVTQVQRQAGQLERLAMRDELTGMENRRQFEARLRAACAAGRACVALLDLNGFKNVNDQLGHHVGDRLLAEAGRRFTAAVGDVASVARMGGDEFAVLLPEATDEAAGAVITRVADALATPIRVDGHELMVGASIGLASGAGMDPFEVLRRADVAMYAAKERGESFRWFSPELDLRAREEARIGAELRTALDAGQLRLVYQPIVELPHGRLAGVEALVRWDHPERGVISPNVFIPVAERNGMIIELGAWVIREACRQAARWRAECGAAAPDRISVNVSARQLARPGLAAVVADALTDTGLPPACLIIEVTETAVLDGGRAVQTLHELIRLGARLALDDFGTGHSSLTLLQTVPAHVLKVDKSFIDGITAGGRQAVICTALIQVANGLGMSAIAEGVETAEQAAELYRLGYRLAQGHHFAHPTEDLPVPLTSTARTPGDHLPVF